MPAYEESANCHEGVTTSIPSTEAGSKFGFSVGLVRFGVDLFLGPQPFEDRQAVLAGAPAADGPTGGPADSGVGFLLDVATNGDITGIPTPLVGIGSPVGSTGDLIGMSVLGVDVLEPYDDTGPRAFHPLIAAGEEILLGAPATPPTVLGIPAPGFPASGDGPGAIHLFYNGYDGVVGDDALVADRYDWFYQGSYTPPTAAANAEFGRSMAKADGVYGLQSDFIVVGAPGEDAVYIIDPDPAWTPGASFGLLATADPFGPGAVVTKIDGTTIGAAANDRFGQTVLVTDLDSDGNLDVVIGAPQATTLTAAGGVPTTGNGAVWVLPGTGSASSPTPWVDVSPGVFQILSPNMDPLGVDPSLDTVVTSGGAGTALAAGRLRGPTSPPVLAVGVPGMTGLQGGICQYHWPSTLSAPAVIHCERSGFHDPSFGPFPNAFALGQSLAAGNFSRHDIFGSKSSPEATIEELASGHSGSAADALMTRTTLFGGGTFKDYSYQEASSARGGVVTVHRSEIDQGAQIDIENPGSLRDHFSHQVVRPPGGNDFADFGSALMAADLGIYFPYPRLIIGTPDHETVVSGSPALVGSVSVTRPSAANGLDDPLSGTYSVTDSAGIPLTARLLGGPDGYILVIPNFFLELVDGSGSNCASGTFSGTTTVDIVSEPISLSSGGTITTDLVLVDEDGDEVVTLPLTVAHSSSGNTLSVTISEPRVGGADPWPFRACGPVVAGGGTAFLLDSFTAMACE